MKGFMENQDERVVPIRLWAALNGVAVAVQKSAVTETAVYHTLAEQLQALGLHGRIAWLDTSQSTLTIMPVTAETAVNDDLTPIPIPLVVQKLISKGEPQFVPHLSVLNLPTAEWHTNEPAILILLREPEARQGLFMVSGAYLRADDLLAVSALAAHLAVALANARRNQQTMEVKAALRLSEERFRVMVENAPGVMYICKNDYRFTALWLNNAVELLTGYPKELFLSEEIAFRDLYHPDDDAAIQPIAEEALHKRSLYHHIYRIRHRSGEWRWVEEYGTAVLHDDGSLMFLEGSIIDVTERIQDDRVRSVLYQIATVANSDLSLEDLYGQIHQIVGELMDAHNFYIALYDAALEILELPYFVDEVDSFYVGMLPAPGGLTRHVIATGQPHLLTQLDIRQLQENGVAIPLGPLPQIWLGVPLQIRSRVVGAIVVQNYRDAKAYTNREKELLHFVSGQVASAIDRKRSEEELRALALEMEQQARMFDAILSTTLDYFAVYDRDGRIEYASKPLLRLLQKEMPDVLGKQWEEVGFTAEMSRRMHQDRLIMLQTGQSMRNEIQTTLPGRFITLEYIFSPLLDDEGNVARFISAARDITERNRTTEALNHAQKLESLGILAGGVAHDFNNLLVAMLAQTSLAQAKLPADAPAVRHIAKAVQAAEKAALLTRQLLAYSGRGQFTVQLLDLNQLIRENFELLSATLPKQIELTLELMPDLPAIEADPGQMQQVVMNLILNSGEAIGEIHGRITVQTHLRYLSVQDEAFWQMTRQPLPPGYYVAFTVRDTGPGVPEEKLPRIFDPFYTTKFVGRGLGLAAVLGIVRGHKGGLNVYNHPQTGVVFELVFPLTEDHPLRQMVEPAPTVLPKTAVLVVDDDPSVREAIVDICALEGIDVLSAENGKTAVELYAAHQQTIGVVLLDLSLPGMDGAQIFAALRAINPQVSVVVSSGHSPQFAMKSFDSDQVQFLQKPYRINALLRVVRDYLH
jgi:PAS domain S-box-containing protein